MEPGHEQESVESKEAEVTIRKFATRIWENPLIDDETRNARQEGLKKAAEVIKKFDIADDEYAGFLVGGLRYGHSNGSDVDVLFYTTYRPLKDNFIRYRGKLGITLMNQDIDPVRIISPKKETGTPLSPAEAFAYLDFLTTPDEYVIGSQKLVEEARMEALNVVEQSPNGWEEIKRQFEANFSKYFRSPIVSDPDSLNLPEGVDQESPVYKSAKKRLDKVMPRIKKRALQSKIPDYEANFVKALDKFELPSFSTFKLGFKATGGALRMIERYKAQGI